MLVDDLPIASFESIAAPPPRPDGRAEGKGGQPRVFNIRLASSAGDRRDAGALLRRRYAWRGYTVHPSDQASEYGAGRMTFYAEAEGELVGTMSLALDVLGRLPADENFGDRLAPLRRAGRSLCEPSRLAIDAGMSKRVFAALIHISYLYAHKLRGCSDYVIEVNPRHVAFYQRMLGFAGFGAERPCSRVGAPAVLLRLPLDVMGARIRAAGGSFAAPGAERSFYPYFFAPRDEAAISARLAVRCLREEAA